MSIYKRLYDILQENLFCDEPMKNHTTFKIGGAADYVAIPAQAGQIIEVLRLCKNEGVPYVVMGNGSNLLFSDKGFRGVVIKLCSDFGEIKVSGCSIFAQSGALLSRVSSAAASAGLEGLEFAGGIPGTLGGAVFMNAGAYGGEMADVVYETEYIDKNLKLVKTREHFFSYRGSIFQKNGGIVVNTMLRLREGDPDKIRERMAELSRARREKQPLDKPSAGSAFKRPKDGFAAALIDGAGLKGALVGGAQVSLKHAGFIVNTGDATAADVLALMEYVKMEVEKKYNIRLESEIRFVGEN